MIVARTCPSCEYTASYISQRQADAHHPRHSCAKHQQRAEMARQRALRAQQGPTRPCHHPRAQHIHGTRAAYVKDRCRCAPCTAANAAAWAATHRAQAFGQWEPFVEAAPIRDHIGQLREAGIGVDQIAKLAGTSTSHIRELAEPGQPDKPPVHKVRPDTAKRILSIQATAANRGARSHLDARTSTPPSSSTSTSSMRSSSVSVRRSSGSGTLPAATLTASASTWIEAELAHRAATPAST